MTLSSSISMADACSRDWDVVVIGAGPAGTVAARQLALQKLHVLLIERKAFPRYKVCGCCLNQRALSSLQAIGLGAICEDLGAVPLNSFQMRFNGREATVPLPGGLAISRSVFDERLVQAAIDEGVCFLPETTAILKNSAEQDQTRQLELTQQGQPSGAVSAKMVLAADGLGHPSLQQCDDFESTVSQNSRLGVGALLASDDFSEYPTGVIHMAIHKSGYVGLVRVEDGRVNLAAAIDRDFIKQSGSPTAAVLAILQASGFPAFSEISEGSFKGTIPFTRKTLRPVGNRVFVLGDAAGYLEPFTGEGMANAIADAVAVAQIAPRGLVTWDHALEQEWLKKHHKITDGRLYWCRWLALLLRLPVAVGIGLRLFHLFPAVARPIVARLNH
ncbi:NAD(P)/FAD-dependent oxidoreductase [uncultured Gimesia sp.]|uniref:NAD(P)/FAD-dependent oxidoreductase n=1 Tax=uncultured Gimesia sp. TaxID=1678688 RepID=UPI0030DAC1E5|tara:strand:- start:51885 stop:53048 length:1164 start_codon:yes stop_codon:yes gene_type:complete